MDFEENQVPEAILDKLTKVCTCRSISRKTIKEPLNGADTFQSKRSYEGWYWCLRWQGLWTTDCKITKKCKKNNYL